MVLKHLGKTLHLYRKSNGWSQEVMADRLQCAPSTLSGIETGKTCPNPKTFDKICVEFEINGFTYNQLLMEDNIEFQKAKEELLLALYSNNNEIIEKKLEKFKRYMDVENEDHQKYVQLSDLVYMLKEGMGKEEFVKQIEKTFPIFKEMSDLDSIRYAQLTKIEDFILYKMANTLSEIGYLEKAEELFELLLSNCYQESTEYYKKRINNISASLAKLLMTKKDYEKAEYCMGYIFMKILENIDGGVLFQILCLQENLFKEKGNEEAVKIINNFLKSAATMVNFLTDYYAIYE